MTFSKKRVHRKDSDGTRREAGQTRAAGAQDHEKSESPGERFHSYDWVVCVQETVWVVPQTGIDAKMSLSVQTGRRVLPGMLPDILPAQCAVGVHLHIRPTKKGRDSW
jgi:hypothetical protein